MMAARSKRQTHERGMVLQQRQGEMLPDGGVARKMHSWLAPRPENNKRQLTW